MAGAVVELSADLVQRPRTDTLVGLARLFANLTSAALCRAINTYRHLGMGGTSCKRVGRARTRRAKRLSDTELACLADVERYKSGATVYELAPKCD